MAILWLTCGILLLVLLFIAHKNTYKATFRRVSLSLPHPRCRWKDLRILHLSDLHMENISITPETLYETLKGEKIDLIALTGDYLDRARNIPKLRRYLEILQRLQPKYGTFAVFGNHDYVLKGRQFARLIEMMRATGVHVLRNEHKTIDLGHGKLAVIGIDDHSTNRSDPEQAFAGIDEEAFRLVLSHDPNIVLEIKHYRYDYLLSGHFHGGQIHWPKPYHLAKMGKLPRMQIIKGLNFIEDKAFYISEGLGQTGFNLRVKSRPEITVHAISTAPACEEIRAVTRSVRAG
ncbi:metallophosphoesterase [Bacillaceae bacterium]